MLTKFGLASICGYQAVWGEWIPTMLYGVICVETICVDTIDLDPV